MTKTTPFNSRGYKVTGKKLNRYTVTWPDGTTSRYWGVTARMVGTALKNSNIPFKSVRKIK